MILALDLEAQTCLFLFREKEKKSSSIQFTSYLLQKSTCV